MSNIHSHAVNVEKSCPLDRKCQRPTQKTSVGDSVSSNLYNVGVGGSSLSFFFFFLLIFNFSLRLDRISAWALYYLDIHKPYTLNRTVTSQNVELSGALHEEILCSKWNHQDCKRRVCRWRQRGRISTFYTAVTNISLCPRRLDSTRHLFVCRLARSVKVLDFIFFPSFLLSFFLLGGE